MGGSDPSTSKPQSSQPTTVQQPRAFQASFQRHPAPAQATAAPTAPQPPSTIDLTSDSQLYEPQPLPQQPRRRGHPLDGRIRLKQQQEQGVLSRKQPRRKVQDLMRCRRPSCLLLYGSKINCYNRMKRKIDGEVTMRNDWERVGVHCAASIDIDLERTVCRINVRSSFRAFTDVRHTKNNRISNITTLQYCLIEIVKRRLICMEAE